MNTLFYGFWATAGLAAAVYAHARIPAFTKPGNVMLLRLVLIATGIGAGYVMTDRAQASVALLSFLAWFGAVHIPAACILLLKTVQHAGRS